MRSNTLLARKISRKFGEDKRAPRQVVTGSQVDDAIAQLATPRGNKAMKAADDAIDS